MQRYTHHIIKEMLISSYREFLCGHVYPPYTVNQGSAGIKVSLTMLMADWSSRGTVDTSNSLNVLVWYR